MGLSVRAYARHRGVSHVAVMKAVRAGRIPQEADGTIDPVKADAAWDAQTDPGRRAASAPKPVIGAAVSTAPTSLRETAPAVPASAAAGSGSSFDGSKAAGATFNQARTAHEVAKAQKARLQVDRLKEEVVDRARATAQVFKLARQERDSWITWPARIAAQMALEAGIDAHTMQTLLETYVRDHLGELAAIEPNFR